jgi:hypothetical protein
MGSNSILISMGQEMIDFGHTTHLFIDGMLKPMGDLWPLLSSIAELAVNCLRLYLLFRKRILPRI